MDLIKYRCTNSEVDRRAKIFFQLQDSNRNVQHRIRNGRLLEATLLIIPARRVSQIMKPFACFCCSLSCMLKKGGKEKNKDRRLEAFLDVSGLDDVSSVQLQK